jgi:sugar lactone lactonase YvrE
MTFTAPMKRLLLLLAMSLSIKLADGKQVPTFASADLVLGQTDFTSANIPATPDPASLDTPSCVGIDPATGKVFVADPGNHRVLRYANAAALQSGASADRVFGQADFSGHAALATPTASSLKSPAALWIDGSGRLWVADTGNNRVVMYPNAATQNSNGPAATLVLGQPDAISGTALPTSAASLSSPEGLCVDSGGRLWVADTGNNRVLKFDGAAGNTTGDTNAEADREFGQSQGATAFTTSASGTDNLHFTGPSGVTVDANGVLWVSDRGNNRIMGFPSAATISNGANGARILGQPDYNFGSTTPGLSSSAISGPTGLFADAAGNLWVLDQGNNRALKFSNIASIDNGRPASIVVGQPDFTSNAPDLDARHLDTQGASAFAGLFVQADGTLWIADRNHNRVLRFSTVDSGPPTIRIAGKRKVATPKKRIVVRGIASDDTGVTQVTLQAGRKQIPAAGTTAWKKAIRLKKTRTVIKAFALDAAGKMSAPANVVVLRKAVP